ncbi:MAG: pre-peptidase C-terminal domain-containing protein [Rudaea sp.]
MVPTQETKQAIDAWNDEFYHVGLASNQPTASQGQLSYGGGVGGVGVLSGQSKVYIIFYGTQWGTQTTDSNGNFVFSGDSFGAAQAAQNMFKGIGTNGETWSADLTQWCDGAGVATGATSCPASGASYVPYQQNIYAGVWYDNSVASPASASGTQLAQEAVKAAAHFGNTATGSNRHTYYIILSPHGTNPDNYQSTTQGYCAWHDYTGDGYGVTAPGGDIAFSNQPYNMDVGTSCGVGFVNGATNGKLDGYTMTLGHEWHEMMSDQFPAGGWTNHSTGTYAGQENSDECAWIAAGAAGGAANVAFSTGTFTQQASWSNDTGACAISHAILTHGGGGNSPPTANFSFATSGLTATFSDSSSDSDGTISSRAWNFGDSSTSTATNPSHTYAAAGTFSVTETVTDNGGATGTVTKSVTVTTTSGGSVLTNGVPVTGLAATTGNKLNYTMAVPAGATNLKFAISGGTGDADLYVKFGSAPTTSSYDCRPYVSGNSETCTIATIQAGTYYVMLNAYASFTGVTLTGSYTAPGSGGTPSANFTFATSGLTATFTDTSTDSGGSIGSHSWNFGDSSTSTTTSPSHTYAASGTYSVSETVTDSVNGSSNTKTSSVTVTSSGGGNALSNGVPVTGLAGTKNTLSAAYTLTVPSGKSTVTIKISGGTGDADLYVKLNAAPTLSTYDCRPYVAGNSETCTFTPPSGGGTYYIKLNAYATYSSVSLTGSYN